MAFCVEGIRTNYTCGMIERDDRTAYARRRLCRGRRGPRSSGESSAPNARKLRICTSPSKTWTFLSGEGTDFADARVRDDEAVWNLP